MLKIKISHILKLPSWQHCIHCVTKTQYTESYCANISLTHTEVHIGSPWMHEERRVDHKPPSPRTSSQNHYCDIRPHNKPFLLMPGEQLETTNIITSKNITSMTTAGSTMVRDDSLMLTMTVR